MFLINSPRVLTQSLGSVFWRLINGAAAVEDFSLAAECQSSMGITMLGYLTHNLLDWMSNGSRNDIIVILLFLTNAVSVGICGKSLQKHGYDQTKCQTMPQNH